MSLIRVPAFLVLLATVATGCAVRFHQPEPDAPHALLALPSQQTQHDRGMFFEPLEFNGLTRPRNWLLETFRIPPGQFHLLARAAHAASQGTCQLQFNALAGQTYRLDAALADGRFTLNVLHGGEVVARCSAAATLLPTPASIPGAPSR